MVKYYKGQCPTSRCWFLLDYSLINTCYHINQVCSFPGNMQNFRTDSSTKYFRWMVYYYPRDEKGKGKAFIKLLSGKFSIMYFYQNVQKWSLKKIFIFTPKYQLIRIHIIAESAWVFYKPKNTWKYPYLLQVPFFCLNKVLSFIIIQKMFTIKGSGLNTIGIPTNWWKQILHKVK